MAELCDVLGELLPHGGRLSEIGAETGSGPLLKSNKNLKGSNTRGQLYLECETGDEVEEDATQILWKHNHLIVVFFHSDREMHERREELVARIFLFLFVCSLPSSHQRFRGQCERVQQLGRRGLQVPKSA
jgi:hypothetical protein